jgi:hypothetical protein
VSEVNGQRKRRALLIWGLPRDPVASRHLLGFFVTAVLTVVVTRGALAATGFPQLGGDGLHVAHVLWGGLLQALAVLLMTSFAGPLIRPSGAFIGGIGFGLFIDEIGKFLTDDNDYFYEPAPALMYVTLVVLVLGTDWLSRRVPRAPSEYLAGAADHAVAGLVGGLTLRSRREADRLLELGRDAPHAAELRALLDAIGHDESQVPDPIGAVARRLEALALRVARGSWATAVTVVLVVAALGGASAVVVASWDDAAVAGTTWLVVGATGSALVAGVLALGGLWRLASDRLGAFQLLRGAVLVTLLLTQVAVFRFEPWIGAAGLATCLMALGVIAAERWRMRRVESAAAGVRDGSASAAPGGGPEVDSGARPGPEPAAGSEAEASGGLR